MILFLEGGFSNPRFFFETEPFLRHNFERFGFWRFIHCSSISVNSVRIYPSRNTMVMEPWKTCMLIYDIFIRSNTLDESTSYLNRNRFNNVINFIAYVCSNQTRRSTLIFYTDFRNFFSQTTLLFIYFIILFFLYRMIRSSLSIV